MESITKGKEQYNRVMSTEEFVKVMLDTNIKQWSSLRVKTMGNNTTNSRRSNGAYYSKSRRKGC